MTQDNTNQGQFIIYNDYFFISFVILKRHFLIKIISQIRN